MARRLVVCTHLSRAIKLKRPKGLLDVEKVSTFKDGVIKKSLASIVDKLSITNLDLSSRWKRVEQDSAIVDFILNYQGGSSKGLSVFFMRMSEPFL